MIPSDKDIQYEQLNKHFKEFVRLLKDKGRYTFMINYLFFSVGRTKKEFFADFMGCCLVDADFDFGRILRNTRTLGRGFEIHGYTHWAHNIRDISDEWQKEYNMKYKNVDMHL